VKLNNNNSLDAITGSGGRAREVGQSLLPPLINKGCYERSPSGLVRGSEPGSVVTMKVFVKEDVISPMWIILKSRTPSKDGALTFFVSGEDRNEAVG
jgi:hypothetical protein